MFVDIYYMYGLGRIETTIYEGKTSNFGINHWDIWIFDRSRLFFNRPDDLRSRKGNRCRGRNIGRNQKAHTVELQRRLSQPTLDKKNENTKKRQGKQKETPSPKNNTSPLPQFSNDPRAHCRQDLPQCRQVQNRVIGSSAARV